MGSVLQSGNLGDNEQVAGVGTDNAGNVYVAGKVMGFPTFGVGSYTSHGNYYQGFLAKYNCSGNLIWVQLLLDNYGGDKVTGLAVDGAGNCYLNGFAASDTTYFGNTQYTFGNSPGWFIAKYDSSGAVQWHIFTQTVPGAETERGPVIGINSQGNIIAAGWNYTPGIVFPGINLRKGDFIAAFNPTTGACLWGTNIDTVAVNSNQIYLEILSMKIGTDDDIYFTGWFVDTVKIGSYILNAGNGNHGFILKFNSNGNPIWAKQDYAVSGFSGNQTMALSGNFMYIFGSALRNDTVFNYRITNSGTQVQNNFILKLDTAANLIWGICQDSENVVYSGPLPALEADNNGNLFCTTGFARKIKWGTSYTSIISNPSTGVNPYLLKLSPSGQVLALTSIPSYNTSTNAYDGGEGIAINSLGDIYIGGAFSQKLWATAGDTVYNSGGNVDLFLVKYGAICSNVGVDELAKDEGNIKVFPNPNDGNFTLSYNSVRAQNFVPLQLIITDVMGRNVYKQTLSGEKNIIDVSNLNNGIYFLQVLMDNKTINQKIIINK
jgi:hypothetical protein